MDDENAASIRVDVIVLFRPGARILIERGVDVLTSKTES
jgi:hypothetical protein